MDSILMLISGFVAGAFIVYFYLLSKKSGDVVPRQEFESIDKQNRELELKLAHSLSREIIQSDYVLKELYEKSEQSLEEATLELNQIRLKSQQQNEEIVRLSSETMNRRDVEEKYILKNVYNQLYDRLNQKELELKQKEDSILELNNKLTTLVEKEITLNDKLTIFRDELELLRHNSQQHFKILANEILEEKKRLFVDENKKEINTLLDPLKSDLNQFREKIESTRKEDIQDMTSLKKEIENLQTLNHKLSDDARTLATALKSEVKIQGNWGEDRLNLILEAEGLQRYIDYRREESLKDHEQDVTRRPDFIISLPGNKSIIIDSKVSLTAYVNYYNAETTIIKEDALKQHIKSVTDHIEKLGDKNYQTLSGLTTPDYIFMFMPIESALTLAINHEPEIFNQALKRKIVLITPTTLVATLKIIKLLWQKENQMKNVEEIFRQCGELYNKFVSFLEQMDKVEEGLSTAGKAYHSAMNHLSKGAKKGSTIIGRFEAIKNLEAKTNKNIPDKYLNEIGILPDEISDKDGDSFEEVE